MARQPKARGKLKSGDAGNSLIGVILDVLDK